MYPFSFDGTKFPKILESIKVVDNLHVKLQYNGKPLLLPQWFVQGHNVTMKTEVILRTSQRIYEIPPPATTMNSRMNLIKENFINGKGDHHIYHE